MYKQIKFICFFVLHMATFKPLLCAACCLVSLAPSVCGADFFEKNVLGSDVEWNEVNQVSLDYYRFASPATQDKYNAAQAFVAKFKEQFWLRYHRDNQYSYYKFYDAANEIQFLVNYLNQYFSSMKLYERTGDSYYYDEALTELSVVNQSYARLKNVFK